MRGPGRSCSPLRSPPTPKLLHSPPLRRLLPLPPSPFMHPPSHAPRQAGRLAARESTGTWAPSRLEAHHEAAGRALAAVEEARPLEPHIHVVQVQVLPAGLALPAGGRGRGSAQAWVGGKRTTGADGAWVGVRCFPSERHGRSAVAAGGSRQAGSRQAGRQAAGRLSLHEEEGPVMLTGSAGPARSRPPTCGCRTSRSWSSQT